MARFIIEPCHGFIVISNNLQSAKVLMCYSYELQVVPQGALILL